MAETKRTSRPIFFGQAGDQDQKSGGDGDDGDNGLGGNGNESTISLSSLAPIIKNNNSSSSSSSNKKNNRHSKHNSRSLQMPTSTGTRPRSLSHHLSQSKVPSRSWLQIQARLWRAGMSLGMLFHGWASPHPPPPAFSRRIPSSSSSSSSSNNNNSSGQSPDDKKAKREKDDVELVFYHPPNYQSIRNESPHYRFPVVVNFHGGGFCLGDARDDRYWARVVTQRTGAIFVSVNYRRAPEAAFPKPVDDCVEALLYISSHAADLHIDPLNVALTGFSAGANLAFSVPLRLRYYKKINVLQQRQRPFSLPPSLPPIIPSQPDRSPFDTEDEDGDDDDDDDDDDTDDDDHDTDEPQTPYSTATATTTIRATTSASASTSTSTSTLLHLRTGTDLQIRSIIAWYPLLDWTKSRAQKKRESVNPQKVLSQTLTDLFDFSYLPPPDVEGLHCSPYASPGLAPDHMLSNGLPHDVQIWLCEWDMLLHEGRVFAARLEQLGKNVDAIVVPRVPHGWDKSPNPFRDQAAIDLLYDKAARGLAEVFSQDDGLRTRTSSIAEGIVGRQPRRSIVLPV